MENQQPFQPQAPQNAPQQYAPAPVPAQPAYAPQQPGQVPQAPAVKPKKGWGKLILAFACLPLLIVGEVGGLILGAKTPLGEDLGAELGGALVAVVLCCLLGGTKLLDINKSSFKWAWHAVWWSIAISAGIAIFDLYETIAYDEFYVVHDWPWQIFLSIIFCLFIGFFEEFMVRGLVLNGLLARMGTNRKGIVWACILSSLFFGLLHVDLSRIGDVTGLEFLQGVLKVVQTGMYGFALAAVVCKTGEAVSAALLHGLDDWLLFVLTFVMGESLETEYVASGTEEGWTTVIVYVVCIVLYIPLIVRAIKTLKTIDTPNRGAFFRERKGVIPEGAAVAAAAPAGYAAPVVPQGYPAPQPSYPQQPAPQPQYPQQAPAQQPFAQPSAPVPPVNPIPTQIPEGTLYQTGQTGAPGAPISPDQQKYQ